MFNPDNFVPAVWLTLGTVWFLFHYAWKTIMKREGLDVNDVILGFFFFFALQGIFLGIVKSLPQPINFCDHYKLKGAKKVCVPIDQFILPAPFLSDIKSTNTSSAKIYDASGKEVGNVPLQILKSNNYLIIKLPDNIQQKLMEYLENDKHIFYLDVFINGKLLKAIPFDLEE